MEIFLSVVLLVVSVLLVVVVLLQPGKSHKLSGSIAGGAETFFGKSKARGMEALLSKATIILAILFVLLVVVMYVMQDTQTMDDLLGDLVIEDSTGTAEDETADNTDVTDNNTDVTDDNANADDNADAVDDTNVSDDADASDDANVVEDNADANVDNGGEATVTDGVTAE